jgi:hypothetical protein
MSRTLLLAAALALPAFGQEPRKPVLPPGVDQKKIDEAIRRGVEALKNGPSPAAYEDEPEHAVASSDELLLWTFVHAGVAPADATFQELLRKILEAKLVRTYPVSLQAMILEEIDRVKHQDRIRECAQFLVDNQCRNGQWSYGTPTSAVLDLATEGKGPEVATGGPERKSSKPAVMRRLPVKKARDGPSTGDNSNSQYAALGLRACHDAGIVVPNEVLVRAHRWWRDSLRLEKGPQAYVTGGWGYKPGDKTDVAYASMTAGAVGALVIYDAILEKDWKKDPAVIAGMNGLAHTFTVAENRGQTERNRKAGRWHYYYLYALERVGMLYSTRTIGAHDWYRDGANYLLDAQRADGSWQAASLFKKADDGQSTWDTCFAILFLKRATRALVDVASVDKFNK